MGTKCHLKSNETLQTQSLFNWTWCSLSLISFRIVKRERVSQWSWWGDPINPKNEIFPSLVLKEIVIFPGNSSTSTEGIVPTCCQNPSVSCSALNDALQWDMLQCDSHCCSRLPGKPAQADRYAEVVEEQPVKRGAGNRLSCLDVKWSNKLVDSPIHKVRRNVGYLTYPRRNGAPEPLCHTSHHPGAHVASPSRRKCHDREPRGGLRERTGGTACPRRWMRCVGRHPLPCRTSGTLRPPCPLSAVKIAGHGADSPPRGGSAMCRWWNCEPLIRSAAAWCAIKEARRTPVPPTERRLSWRVYGLGILMRAAAEFPPRSEAETHCPDRRSFKLPYRRGGGGGRRRRRRRDDDTGPRWSSALWTPARQQSGRLGHLSGTPVDRKHPKQPKPSVDPAAHHVWSPSQCPDWD